MFIAVTSAFAQQNKSTSGFLIGGGAGTLDYEFVKDLESTQIGRQFDETYNYDLHLGYRFRLQHRSRLFWDLDVLAGVKSLQNGTILDYSNIFVQYANGKKHLNYFIALSPTINVRIIKGLYAGTGIEPTCHIYQSENSGMAFDLPANLKLGYDFGKWSIEASAKIGLIRHSIDHLLQHNRKKEFQLSIYIPLTKFTN